MKIAYLTNCFGIQSHTFIRREIAELTALGISIELFGIRQQISDKLTDDERALVARTVYLYPLRLMRIAYLNVYWMLVLPKRYWPTLWMALRNSETDWSRRLKLIYHFIVSTAMAEEVRNRGVEHIHAHFLNVSATIAMYASLLTGVPYSITVHSAGTRNAPHIIGIPLKLRYAQFLMMISRYNIDYFDDIYPCRSKSSVVRCGMDLDQYPFNSRPATPVVNGLKVVAVGRMVEKKGFRYLIEAAKILQDQGGVFTIELLGSGPLRDELVQLAESLGVNDKVRFLGQASTAEVRVSMRDADVVVVPSVTGKSGEMEGIPVVLMEAMALGVPVISTRHSGIPELVRNGETGIVVEEKNPSALASALQYIAGNQLEPTEWAANARALIEREFNMAVVARQRKSLFLKHHLPRRQ